MCGNTRDEFWCSYNNIREHFLCSPQQRVLIRVIKNGTFYSIATHWRHPKTSAELWEFVTSFELTVGH